MEESRATNVGAWNVNIVKAEAATLSETRENRAIRRDGKNKTMPAIDIRRDYVRMLI